MRSKASRYCRAWSVESSQSEASKHVDVVENLDSVVKTASTTTSFLTL